jgi:hypothetical protein
MEDRRTGMSLQTKNLDPDTVPNSSEDAGEHPSADTLHAYHRGRLTEADEDRIQEHFIACADCRATMLELADFLDGVSEPSRWSSEDLVREWRKVRAALQKGNSSGRAAEALAGRHG